MDYRALYRKYRPTTFDQVCGQDSVVSILRNSISSDKISHAYLFSGPRGSGKTSVAKLFARSVGCLDNKNGNPCLKCEVCLQIDNNQIDIIEIDAASNNGVDEIRELRSKVNLMPNFSKYKVYIIDEVHMLSTGAFNALLKTLEEPPKHVIFILATTEVHKIPITIISRCQRFDFRRISIFEIEKRLTEIAELEEIKIDESAIKYIASLSDGGLRDAIGYLDQLSSFKDGVIDEEDVASIASSISKKTMLSLFNCILNGEVDQFLKNTNVYYESGKDLKKIAEGLLNISKDLMIKKIAPQYYIENYTVDLFTNEYDTKNMYQLVSVLGDIVNKMNNNYNPKLIFEVEIINFIDTNINVGTDIEPVESVIQRIDVKDSSSLKNEKIEVEKKGNAIVTIEEIKAVKKTKKSNTVKIVDISKIEELIEIRVNNTFANAKKTNLNKIKEEWKKLSEYGLVDEYKKLAMVLLDGSVEIASDDHIVISYPYKSISDQVNRLLLDVEEIVCKLLNSRYKVIAIDKALWIKEKELYLQLVNEKQKREIIEENIDFVIEVEVEEGKNSILEMFGDLVEIK